MRRSFAFMLVMRAVYLAFLAPFVVRQNWAGILFAMIIFCGTLIVPYLGKRDEQFYVLDALIMLTFTIAFFPSYTNGWPKPATILEAVLGFDKLFHMAGGACLAMFAAIILRKHVSNPYVFYTSIVLFALAMGGAWEIYEWIMSELPAKYAVASSGYMDSMLDMAADTLGAAILAVVLRLRRYL